MSDKKLSGLNVVSFESRHAKTIADLIALQGGRPFSAPAMKEVPLGDNPEVFGFAEKLFAGRIDALVLLTGVGARYLVEVLETKHPREKIFQTLKKTTIIPRGPKPVRVLKEWGIPFALNVPEPNTWREILQSIDENSRAVSLKGKTVAVQEYGVPNPELIQGLEQRGALVLRIPVYRWALPDDLKPLQEAIRKMASGEMHVALFTTAVQIEHVLRVAEPMNVAASLKDAWNRIVVASVGPDCSEALRGRGLPVDIEPESPKMGPLVQAVSERAKHIWDAKQNARK